MRYVFSSGFVWSEEIARICFIYLVYLGTIDAYRDNRHLGVEMLVARVKPGAQGSSTLAIQGIVIWMMAILTIGVSPSPNRAYTTSGWPPATRS